MFTDKYLKGIKPKTSAYRIFEKGVDKGFGIKVTPAGSISFFVQYAIGGPQRFMNLGRYPSVSLSEARERCRHARLSIDRGIDPQAQKVEEQRGTVGDLFEHYVSSMRDSGKRTWREVEKTLNANCGGIMTMPAQEVKPEHIRAILYELIKRGSEVQANRLRSYLHRAFKMGMQHDHDPRSLKNVFTFGIEQNPVAAIPKNSAAEIPGERALTFDELAILWTTPNLSKPMLIAAKLLVFYGVRSWELFGAQWSEFDFEALIWSIPPARVKNGRWNLLPITPHAAAWLEELRPYSRGSEYLFPGRYDEAVPIGKTSFGHACRKVQGIAEFTPRDLRRTFKTRTGEAGIDKTIRDRIQNHALSDVSSKHYDRYDYLNEKRSALMQWGARLELLGPDVKGAIRS